MFDQNARRESSWATPLRILTITLVLSAGFLYYYFGPTVDDLQGNIPQASVSDYPISLSIGGLNFSVPENFTQFPRARRGGERSSVALYAMMPELTPYTLENKEIFEGNLPDSPLIHFQIETYVSPLTEAQRIERIYLNSVVDTSGEAGPAGLTRFAFSEDTGYREDDLFLGRDENHQLVAFICMQALPGIPSPSCRRDTQLSDTISLKYRFKRVHLNNWRTIDADVHNLARSFLVSDNNNDEAAIQ